MSNSTISAFKMDRTVQGSKRGRNNSVISDSGLMSKGRASALFHHDPGRFSGGIAMRPKFRRTESERIASHSTSEASSLTSQTTKHLRSQSMDAGSTDYTEEQLRETIGAPELSEREKSESVEPIEVDDEDVIDGDDEGDGDEEDDHETLLGRHPTDETLTAAPSPPLGPVASPSAMMLKQREHDDRQA